MRKNPANMRPPSTVYVEKAKALSKGDAERLEERVMGRFTRRSDDRKKARTDVIALQLEFEDLQLDEWRNRLTKIRQNENAHAAVSQAR